MIGGIDLDFKPVFYDSDILICFLAISRHDILKKLFSKVIIPAPVYYELTSIEKYKNVNACLNSLEMRILLKLLNLISLLQKKSILI